MKLIDVKLPKKTTAELKSDCQPIGYEDREQWPYGLQIRFEKEQIAKMPEVAKMKVGDTVSVSGIGKVTSVRMSERHGGEDDHSVEVQLEKVGVSLNKKLGEMNMAEYTETMNRKEKERKDRY